MRRTTPKVPASTVVVAALATFCDQRSRSSPSSSPVAIDPMTRATRDDPSPEPPNEVGPPAGSALPKFWYTEPVENPDADHAMPAPPGSAHPNWMSGMSSVL
jgi:hypothetical protein